jgi:lysophospholipase L1-like esterase
MKRIGFALVTVLSLVGCDTLKNLNSPVAPENTSLNVVYSAVGASDAIGYGSSNVCVPFTSCPDGKGYVQVITRRYKDAGKTVTLQNLGVPGAVLGPTVQALAPQMNYTIPVNFVENELPFVKSDSTLVTIFAGGNDANTIGSAVRAGLGGSNPEAWANNQIATFGNDMKTLVAGIKAKAPNARIVILNLPNLAAMPYSAGLNTTEKRALQTIAVGLNAQINATTSLGAVVVDLMCDSRAYSPSIFSSDGFHPNDSGYALFADLLYAAATGTAAAPKSSCSYMSVY